MVKNEKGDVVVFNNLNSVSSSWSDFLITTIHDLLELHSCRSAMSANGKRVVFTGGSGKAGRHAIAELLKKGYKVSELPTTSVVQTDLCLSRC